MTKANREWHDKNRLLKKATTKERVKWHLEHAKECSCRPISAKIQRNIDKTIPKTAKKVALKKSSKK